VIEIELKKGQSILFQIIFIQNGIGELTKNLVQLKLLINKCFPF